MGKLGEKKAVLAEAKVFICHPSWQSLFQIVSGLSPSQRHNRAQPETLVLWMKFKWQDTCLGQDRQKKKLESTRIPDQTKRRVQ